MSSDAAKRREPGRPLPPPFRPDPELIGHIEGNKRIIRQDRAAARKSLRDHGLLDEDTDTSA